MNDQLIVQGINSQGFGIIPKLIMQDRNISATAKCIYAYFCSFAGAGGQCFPTRKKICYDLCISQDTLSKHLNQLIKYGYISCEQIKENGRFSHNVYTLVTNLPLPKISDTVESDTKLPLPKISDTVKLDTKNNNNNKNNKCEDIKENIKEKTQKPQTENEDIKNAVFEIINYLNKKTNKNYDAKYRVNINLINDRLNEGYSIADFKTVIDKKVEEWQGTKWEDYLRPITLFSDKNFNGYLNNSHYQKLTRNKNLSNLNGKYEYTVYDRFDTVGPNYDIEEYERLSKYNI